MKFLFRKKNDIKSCQKKRMKLKKISILLHWEYDAMENIIWSFERHRGWFYLFYTANAAYPQTLR